MSNFYRISEFELEDKNFIFFRDKIFDLSGIYLSEKKRDLVQTRLRSYFQKAHIESFDEYRKLLETSSPSSETIQIFINLLTTNKTEFFREIKHFEFLKNEAAPVWIMNQSRNINVWCCATSTGEEPYTISMVLAQSLPRDFKFRVLASDIDTDVLRFAKNGVYRINKLQEIPSSFYKDFITEGKGSAAGWFKIKDNVHSAISFKQHNLMNPSSPGDEVFDVIFCRNVLIYFTPEGIRALLTKLHKCLKKDGILIIGHSESIQGATDLFKTIHPAIFKKVS